MADNTTFHDYVHRFVSSEMEARSLRLETLLADAIALQDYDRLDDLIVVDQEGRQGVASMIRSHPYWAGT